MSRGLGVAQRWVLAYLHAAEAHDPLEWHVVDHIGRVRPGLGPYLDQTARRAAHRLERAGLVETQYEEYWVSTPGADAVGGVRNCLVVRLAAGRRAERFVLLKWPRRRLDADVTAQLVVAERLLGHRGEGGPKTFQRLGLWGRTTETLLRQAFRAIDVFYDYAAHVGSYGSPHRLSWQRELGLRAEWLRWLPERLCQAPDGTWSFAIPAPHPPTTKDSSPG